MKAAQITNYGEKEVVIISNIPQPVARAGEILVKVHAASVNPIDWKIQAGYLAKMAPLTFPKTMGMDLAGVVEQVGESSSEFHPGDVVYGQSVFFGAGGAFAEYAICIAKGLAGKPTNVTYEEAAALPLTGVSAIQAITEHIALKSGQKILVHGGAGGIGSMAIQIAKNIGAYVATTASKSEADYVKALGADEIIDYESQKFEEVLKEYDAVYDTVGGETYIRSYKVLKEGGVLVSMIEKPTFALNQQYNVKAISQNTELNTDRLITLKHLVERGVVKVHIDKIFTLDESGEALLHLKKNHPRGKVVIRVK